MLDAPRPAYRKQLPRSIMSSRVQDIASLPRESTLGRREILSVFLHGTLMNTLPMKETRRRTFTALMTSRCCGHWGSTAALIWMWRVLFLIRLAKNSSRLPFRTRLEFVVPLCAIPCSKFSHLGHAGLSKATTTALPRVIEVLKSFQGLNHTEIKRFYYGDMNEMQ